LLLQRKYNKKKKKKEAAAKKKDRERASKIRIWKFHPALINNSDRQAFMV
jgi:hypothetical protein